MVVHPIYLIVIPLLLAFLSLWWKRLSTFLAFFAPLFNMFLIFKLFPLVLQKPMVLKLGGNWNPPLSIVMVISPLSLILAFIVAFLGTMSAFFAFKYLHHGDKSRYSALFLLLITGATGVVLTGDIFNLFVFFEILCISSYILVSFYKKSDSYEAAFKYLVQGSLGSAFILMGIAILYQKFGTLTMADIANHIAFPLSVDLKIALAFLIIGFGVEAAIFPLNAWLPDAHPAAPATISAMLSGIAIKTGVYAIFRVVFTVFGFAGVFKPLFLLGFITLFFGEISAFAQKDMKRLLAYSSIGQIGLIVIALSLGNQEGVRAGLFQILNHALSKGLLFLASGYYLYKYGTRNIKELEGKAKENVCVFLFMIIAVASLLGIPPFLGFFSKFSIFLALLHHPDFIYRVVAIGVALLTGVEAAYFIRMLGTLIYTEEKIKFSMPKMSEITMTLPLLIMAVIIIVGGLMSNEYWSILTQAASDLIEKKIYITNVLGGI